jgi:hypothetical protein
MCASFANLSQPVPATPGAIFSWFINRLSHDCGTYRLFSHQNSVYNYTYVLQDVSLLFGQHQIIIHLHIQLYILPTYGEIV